MEMTGPCPSMFVDSHCHLDFPDYEADLSEVLHRAGMAGVALMVSISTRVSRFGALRELAEAHPNIFCSVGTHPHNAAEELDVTAERLVVLSAYEKCVAIGEAGLDYHYDKSPRAAQAQGFRVHIEAARQSGLPLVIHARNADEDIERILVEETGKGAFPFLLHCFSSGARLAEVGVELGGYVSFSGILTFKNSQDIRSVARHVPSDRLLIETDAPYLAPPPHRGRRNEPSYVIETARVLSEVIGADLDQIARATTENFFRLFKKVPRSLMRDPVDG
jgi:TatD DNase family protein